ncbi:hypothetical protein OAN68_01345 [Candidatus Pelagibacter sp.]|nr:hypothetical protein [Candidatus Pelagibacter sp.]
MKKKYFFLASFVTIILLYGCGYKPVYSSKNFSFKINKITNSGNKIDNRITRSIKSLSNNNSTNNLNLNLNSQKEKAIVSKGKTGDPEIFQITILVSVEVNNSQKTFTGKQIYNNIENKFELNEYEIQVESQIINKIIDEIIIYLSSV